MFDQTPALSGYTGRPLLALKNGLIDVNHSLGQLVGVLTSYSAGLHVSDFSRGECVLHPRRNILSCSLHHVHRPLRPLREAILHEHL